MSYDIDIRGDERFQTSVARSKVEAFLKSRPGVDGNGAQCLFQEGDRLWMSLDLSRVNADGDVLPDSDSSAEINRIVANIPYAYWERGIHAEQYLGLCCEVAAFLGWEAYDPQVDECFDRPDFLEIRARQRSAWYPGHNVAASADSSWLVVPALENTYVWNLQTGGLEAFWPVASR